MPKLRRGNTTRRVRAMVPRVPDEFLYYYADFIAEQLRRLNACAAWIISKALSRSPSRK